MPTEPEKKDDESTKTEAGEVKREAAALEKKVEQGKAEASKQGDEKLTQELEALRLEVKNLKEAAAKGEVKGVSESSVHALMEKLDKYEKKMETKAKEGGFWDKLFGW